MIKEPPMLRIRRRFARPSKRLLAGFAGVPTGYLVDAMGGYGCLDYRIKPITTSSTVMMGTAVTCHAGPADNLALFGALHAAGKGDILVAATDSCLSTSITGDLLLGMAKNRGIAGFVTDGLIRDLVGVLGVGLPVYCAGITANSPARNGPGTVGMPVVLGGVQDRIRRYRGGRSRRGGDRAAAPGSQPCSRHWKACARRKPISRPR